MKIISDIGSTKSEWAWIKPDGSVQRISEIGFNPNYQSAEEIATVFQKVLDQTAYSSTTQLYIYGAGIDSPKSIENLKKALASLSIKKDKIHIHSDLLAAAQAAYGDNTGLIAILGTGSNISYYDGEKLATTNSLGYVLADEGGGVDLGKELLRAFIYGQLPTEIENELKTEFQLSKENIIHSLYFKKYPQKYLASFAPFIAKYKEEDKIQRLIFHCFDRFFKGPAAVFKSESNQIKLIGSIGLHFQEYLQASALHNGFEIVECIQKPMERLIDFHKSTN